MEVWASMFSFITFRNLDVFMGFSRSVASQNPGDTFDQNLLLLDHKGGATAGLKHRFHMWAGTASLKCACSRTAQGRPTPGFFVCPVGVSSPGRPCPHPGVRTHLSLGEE